MTDLSTPSRRFWHLLMLGVVLGVGLGSCSNQGRLNLFCLSIPGHLTSIRSIQTPRRVGCTVALQGTVGDRVPLIDAQLYQLTEAGDSIWVLTSNPRLQAGTIVRIRGEVRFQSLSPDEPSQGEIYVEERQVEEVSLE